MKETIERNLVKGDKCSMPGWGADEKFYNRVTKSDNGFFVSTGKTNASHHLAKNDKKMP